MGLGDFRQNLGRQCEVGSRDIGCELVWRRRPDDRNGGERTAAAKGDGHLPRIKAMAGGNAQIGGYCGKHLWGDAATKIRVKTAPGMVGRHIARVFPG